ncbi:MAG: hypothetical protein M1833_000213 [Piccolia ochrophora]|nr:MAG: hypothetical protein M1833_000213 [Piccolia ochrophora]
MKRELQQLTSRRDYMRYHITDALTVAVFGSLAVSIPAQEKDKEQIVSIDKLSKHTNVDRPDDSITLANRPTKPGKDKESKPGVPPNKADAVKRD